MLSVLPLVDHDGVAITDVACRHAPGRGRDAERAGRLALVFVRRGCFRREGEHGAELLDATTAYWMRPGEEHRYDHPHVGGDDCTAISLEPALVAALWGDAAPAGALRVAPALDVAHRRLLAAGRRGADPHEAVERAIGVAASALASADARAVAATSRPATAHARRALVDGAREALAADPDRSLPELARALACSPYHLSRLFGTATGHTIARHRVRLRVRAALERLAGGERDLARLAADVGFADHAHLCRAVRAETGDTPSALRAALAPSPAPAATELGVTATPRGYSSSSRTSTR